MCSCGFRAFRPVVGYDIVVCVVYGMRLCIASILMARKAKVSARSYRSDIGGLVVD